MGGQQGSCHHQRSRSGGGEKEKLLEKRHFFQLEVAVRRDSPPCFHMVMCCQHEGGLKYLCDVLPSTSQLISFITFPCKSWDILQLKRNSCFAPSENLQVKSWEVWKLQHPVNMSAVEEGVCAKSIMGDGCINIKSWCRQSSQYFYLYAVIYEASGRFFPGAHSSESSQGKTTAPLSFTPRWNQSWSGK